MRKLSFVVAVFVRVSVVSTICLSAVQSSHAQQVYIGASVMTPGEGVWTYAPGKSVADYDHSLAKKIYGGLELNNNLSIEVGLLDWGYRFRSPLTGNQQSATREAQIKISMAYAATKMSLPVSENFKLFGKAGIARTHTDFNAVTSDNHLRGLFAFGTEYSLTKQLSLQIEFHRAGSIKGTPQQKLETGLRWSF